MADLENLKTQIELEDHNKALVLEWIEQWDLGNFSIADKVIADEFILHMPGGVEVKGAKEFIEAGEPLRIGFPGFKHSIEDVFAKEDMVVIRASYRVIHNGEFLGIPPSGKQVQSTVIAIYKFKEGKCVEMWVESDNLGMMQQLGLELRPIDK